MLPTPISVSFCLHDVFAGCVQTDLVHLCLVTLTTSLDVVQVLQSKQDLEQSQTSDGVTR